MPKPPKLLLALCTLIGVLVVASAAMRIVQGFAATPPLYYSIGFELLALLAGVFAVLTGRGKFADGPGLALLCSAGVVMVATAVTYSTPRAVPLYDIRMLRDPLTAARMGLGAALAGIGALIVLLRRPAVSIKLLLWGALWTGVAIAIAAPVLFARNALSGLNPVLTTVGAVVGFVFFVGFLSAGLHFIIRAFETGRYEPINNAMLPANQPRICTACRYPAVHGRNVCTECGADLLALGSVLPDYDAPRPAAAAGAA